MPYTPILATLGYVFSEDRQRVLLVHRIARGPTDPHHGKYNGLGGKLERHENIVAGMRREIFEEARIHCDELHLAGTVSWPGFGKNGEDWFGFLFRITRFTGNPVESNTEGRLEWVPIPEVLSLPLWPGDRYFLPLIFDFQHPQFHAVMPYEHGHPTAWDAN
jgi:8-oxo-dGTP diphosphatase